MKYLDEYRDPVLARKLLAEIHRIGDLWLKHKDAARLAESIAKKNVEEKHSGAT